MKAQTKASRVCERNYANYFEVGHNPFEFYVDFGQFDPQSQKVEMHTHIVTSPAYAKLLGQTLADSLASFEGEHGPIVAQSHEADPMEMVRESLVRRPERAPRRMESKR